MSEPLFRVGEDVVYRATNDLGRILESPERIAGEYWYRVRIGRRTENIPEDDLDPVPDEGETLESLAAEAKWGQLDSIRCALAIERIVNTNRSTIYTFQNQRILFQPYQYKPLLKILDSPDRRLLIADEVGLGKTIEAGLILTELNARKTLDGVLIVCPSRLREKWRNELNRKFDQDFEIYDRRSLEQAISIFSERPGRNRLRGIVSVQAIRGESIREYLRNNLDGLLDVVIMDEAHHARNENTSTAKLLQELCEIADSVILLTATPVQLHNKDLFTLLNALRPTEFRDAWTFDTILNRHAPVHSASGLARTQDSSNIPEITELLEDVFVVGRAADSVDPLASQLINELRSEPPKTRAQWIDVERRIQNLHPLGTILTRTKKRDVLESAPQRIPVPAKCQWTIQEADAYDKLIKGCRKGGWPSSPLSFGQIQRARQAASCLPAAYETHILGRTDDDSAELTDILPSDCGETFDLAETDTRELGAFRWDGPDSKYALFDDILAQIWQSDSNNKVLVFTFFKGTARYLERRLAEAGVGVLRIDGDVPSDPRKPDLDERGKRLEDFRLNPKIKVMISTEVGSEGLDFQFCHHLVNYDLPWNPMVVEQRIGRIDRFGQKSPFVKIYNLVVEGTVEDRILSRLYTRIGIFEQSIGQLEAILGDTMQSLQRDYIKGTLDQGLADQRVDQAFNAIENRKADIALLEENASQLFGHEEYVREELQRVKNLGQFVSQSSILALLRTYFRSRHPTVKLKSEGNGVFGIKLTDNLRMDIQDAVRKDGISWTDRSQKGILRFTTSGETAFEESSLELVNSQHPLARAAVSCLQKQMEPAISRLGAGVVTVQGEDTRVLPAGIYFVVLAPQQVHGIRNRRLIETFALDYASSRLVSSESSQRILYLLVENGKDWTDEELPALSQSNWSIIRDELFRRTAQLRAKERGENEALYVRRRNAMLAEHEHEIEIKERRLNTSRRRGQEKAITMFEAQIEKAKARHREQLANLDGQQSVSVIPCDPIAACAVKVIHK